MRNVLMLAGSRVLLFCSCPAPAPLQEPLTGLSCCQAGSSTPSPALRKLTLFSGNILFLNIIIHILKIKIKLKNVKVLVDRTGPEALAEDQGVVQLRYMGGETPSRVR